MKKRLLMWLLAVVLFVPLAWSLAACGNSDDGPAKVTLKMTTKNNDKSYVYISSENEKSWSVETDRGQAAQEAAWIWVKPGYQHQNIKLYLDGNLVDSQSYSWVGNSIEGTPVTIDQDYLNVNGTYLQYVFPDAKKDHELVVDAQSVTGYATTVNLQLSGDYLVLPLNSNYQPEQTYFTLDNIVASTAQSKPQTVNGSFGDKILLLSEQERTLEYTYWNISTNSETKYGLTKMQKLGKDYLYSYQGKDYYVYPYTFGFKNTLINDYDYRNGVYMDDKPDLFGIRVVNKTAANASSGYIMGYTNTVFDFDRYTALAKIYDSGVPSDDWKFYHLPIPNDSFACDNYYVYTGAGQAADNAALANYDWANIFNFNDDSHKATFNARYTQALDQVTFFIRAGSEVGIDNLKISFQSRDGQTFEPTNIMTKRKIQCLASATDQSGTDYDVYELCLNKENLQNVLAMFGQDFTDRYLYLVAEADTTQVPTTTFKIIGNFDHTGIGSSTPKLTILGDGVVDDGVIYRDESYHYVDSVVLNKYLVVGNSLQIAINEAPSGQFNRVPYYKGFTATAYTTSGTKVTDEVKNLTHTDGCACVTFNNLNGLAAAATNGTLIIELKLTPKLQTTLDLTAAQNQVPAGTIEFATTLDGVYQDLSTLTTINQGVFLRVSDFWFSSSKLVLYYRETGSSDVILATCNVLCDIFGTEVQDSTAEFTRPYYYLGLNNINIANLDMSKVYLSADYQAYLGA